MNGYELAIEMRDRDKYDHVPVIALTSLASEASRQKGLESGFNEYLVKTDREIFMETITKILTESEPIVAVSEVN